MGAAGCVVGIGLRIGCCIEAIGSCLMMIGGFPWLIVTGWLIVAVVVPIACCRVGWTIITKFWRLLTSWAWLPTPPTVAIS